MATQKETIDFILEQLQKSLDDGNSPKPRFSARAMFGEYALYADEKTVALVCDDLLYVKIQEESAALAHICEVGEPYPGARPHYIVEEDMLARLDELPDILIAIAATRTQPKKKKKAR